MCYNILPDDGVMLLHSIVVPSTEEAEQLGLKTTMTLLRQRKSSHDDGSSAGSVKLIRSRSLRVEGCVLTASRPTNILLDVESVVAALLNAAAAAHVLLNPVLTLGG